MRADEPDTHDERLDERRDEAVRQLLARTAEVGRASGREPWRELLLWLTRGRWGRRRTWPVVPRLGTPWQDTVSAERPGWRTRAANLPRQLTHGGDDAAFDDDFAFAVDYQICRQCHLGWVEQPYTQPALQRRGLARAGLDALRAEHPGFAWHTLGGHINGSPPFWDTVGSGVAGGYRPRDVCQHITAGG